MTEPDFLATTRTAYDVVAATYASVVGTSLTEATETPQDRALLDSFAELVGPSQPVLDVGCGPGRVTAYLAARGLDVSGVDLAPGMVAQARTAHPTLRFEEGSLTSLPVPSASLGGVVGWYSIIHTPLAALPTAFAELRRVLVDGGQLLIAFQAGDNLVLQREAAYGHAVRLDSHRHSPDDVAALLADVGFEVHTRMTRDPAHDFESTPQAYLLARAAPR